jgi:hypothetical protein
MEHRDLPDLSALIALHLAGALPALPDFPDNPTMDDALVLGVVDAALDRRGESWTAKGREVARRALYVALISHPDAVKLFEKLRAREASGQSVRRHPGERAKGRRAAR